MACRAQAEKLGALDQHHIHRCSIPSALLDFEARFRFNPAMAVISSIGIVISAIAVSMLLRRDAREWFSAPPAST